MTHALDSVVCRHPVTRSIVDEHVTARVGVAFTLYSDAALADLGPAVADALEGFLVFAGDGALDTRWAASGWVALTPRAMKAQRKELREKTQGCDFHEFFLGQGSPPGSIGTHAFRFHGGMIGRGVEPTGDHAVSAMTIEFPLEVLERPLEKLVGFFLEVAERVPHSAGNAGLSFRTNWTRANRGADEFVHAHMASYLGVHDGHDDRLRRVMLRRSPDAHWVNLLSTELLDRIGGERALSTLPAGVEVHRLPRGVLLRSAESPPIGDVAKEPSDLGQLPEVGRFLKPVRVSHPGHRWIGRCDGLPGRAGGEWATAMRTSVLPVPAAPASPISGRAESWDASYYAVSAKRLIEAGDYYEAFFRLSAASHAGQGDAAALAESLVRDGHVDDELQAIASFELGVAYEEGRHVPRDAKAAETWLRRAVRLGSTEAAARLERHGAAEIAGQGGDGKRGPERGGDAAFQESQVLLDRGDTFAGFLWLSIAAEEGSEEAAAMIETMIEQTLIEPEEVAAAYLELAGWFASGQNVAVDVRRSRAWLERAADAGSEEAEQRMAAERIAQRGG